MLGSSRRLVWVFHARPWDPAIPFAGGFTDVVLASETLSSDGDSIVPDGTIPGLLQEPYSMRASMVNGRALARHSLPSWGDLVAGNPDGALDHLLDLVWAGHKATLYRGFSDQSVDEMEIVWQGTTQDPSAADKTRIAIPLVGYERFFEEPLQTRRYGPSGSEPYLVFDGTNDGVQFGNVLNITTGSMTLSVSFLCTSAQNAVLVGKRASTLVSSTTVAGWQIGLVNDGHVRAVLANGSTRYQIDAAVGVSYSNGQKHTLTIRKNGTTSAALDYDGVQVGTVSLSGIGSVTTTANFRWGMNGSGTEDFSGRIERVGRWNSNLSAAAVHTAMTIPKPREVGEIPGTTPVGYWPLTENTGSTVGDLGTGGNDGTFEGNTWWSGTPSGTRDLDGKPIPIGYGRIDNARPVCVDPIKLIYQIHDREGQDVFRVTEGGVIIPEDTATTGDIWQVPPDDGHWRWANVSSGEHQGMFIRLANAPTADLTVSFDGNAEGGYASTVVPILQTLLFQHGRPDISLDVEGGDELDDAAPYTVGHYWPEEMSIAEAIDEVLGSVSANWTIDGRDPFDGSGDVRLRVFQPRVLTGGDTPVATYTFREPRDLTGNDVSTVVAGALRLLGTAPVYRDVTVRWRRFQGHIPIGSSLPGASYESRVGLAEEWRSVNVISLATIASNAAFIGAESLTVDTGLYYRGGSLAAQQGPDEEAARLADLYSNRIRIWEVGVLGQFTGWIGDVVLLTGPRYGHSSGRRYLVVGVDEKARRHGTTLTLWGGF